MSKKAVFISYSHDSDAHREEVLSLSERLREDGIETLLDQYVNGTPEQGWPRWMLDQLDAADSVLVVCTETYYRRFRGHEEPGKGKGVDWEGALITQELYDNRSRTLKFVPVFLSAANENWIPEPLRSGTHYALTSKSAYDSLYDFLLEQAGVEPGPVGPLKPKPRRKGTALTFAESPASVGTKVDISRIDKYAPAELIGREAETKLLNDAWAKAQNGEPNRGHVLTFVALGGGGKTSLVAKWAAELAYQDWPGCDAVFAWSFYSQGTREQVAASSDLFLKEALTFFGDPAMAASAQGAFDKGRRLAQLVGERRALLILDGLEPLQYAPTSPTAGELKDQGLSALLKGLAASNHGLCVLTTRYSIPDLKAYWQTTAPEHELKRLSKEAGVALLQQLGVKGSLRKGILDANGPEPQNEFEKLVEDVKGHALTLNLLGTYLRDAHAGDIRRRNLVKLEEADAEEQGGHAFRVMDAYVRWFTGEGKRGKRALAVMYLQGLFDRPVTADCFAALLKPPAIQRLTVPLIGLSEPQLNMALTRLESAKLLTINRNVAGTLLTLDAHPLLREYFARELRNMNVYAWRSGHERLYKHLCETTKEGDQPTLEDLQPLYQAVGHGCHAGMQQEACDKVYYGRIIRREEAYATRKLGAFGSELGAVACFFEQPWSLVSPALKEADQAWLLNQAAFHLRALGRLTEALEPIRAGLPLELRQEDWANAAIRTSNLSEVELTLGEVTEAVRDAKQSMTYADRSGDASLRTIMHATHANALHQAGRRAEAKTRFCETETMQAEDQPDYPLLYSVRGFHYCDLLLTAPERAAWQKGQRQEVRGQKSELVAICKEVEQHAAAALQIVLKGSRNLVDIALNNLTLGSVELYQTILDDSPLATSHSSIENAMHGLRHGGTQDLLTRGLLTRAWLRSLENDLSSSQADLDEAWEIAERGPMPLFMADIHLHRARLFGKVKGEGRRVKYPWESPQTDLIEARRLIEKHGYWRRKEELEDAEAAAAQR